MVGQFPLDFMHGVCLGVMRRILIYFKSCWTRYAISGSQFLDLSKKWVQLAPFFASDFSRKPRPLTLMDRFKATEFRSLLVYGLPIILRPLMKSHCFKVCMALHCGIFILVHACLDNRSEWIHRSKILLKYFVDNAHLLFGAEFVTYNVHSLVHFPDESETFGTLDCYSAFKFENYLGYLRRMVRTGGVEPISQVSKMDIICFCVINRVFR